MSNLRSEADLVQASNLVRLVPETDVPCYRRREPTTSYFGTVFLWISVQARRREWLRWIANQLTNSVKKEEAPTRGVRGFLGFRVGGNRWWTREVQPHAEHSANSAN